MAPSTCIIKNCPSSSKTNSMFCFPNNPALIGLWIEFVCQLKPNWAGPKKNTKICEKHFKTDCFEPRHALEVQFGLMKPTKKQLKNNAVPSVISAVPSNSLMPFCCIPGCESNSHKLNDVSFHKFPPNYDLREKWLRIISRQDWMSNRISNYSRVCSNHFSSRDFKKVGVRKCLIKAAVPSKFNEFPKYMQPPNKNIRLSPFIEKTSMASLMTGKCDNVEDINDDKVKINHYLDKLVEMQQKLDECNRKLMVYKNIPLPLSGFIKASEAAKNGDIYATMLLDLVRNFSTNCSRFEDLTLHNCVKWQASSPEGYDYVRKNLKFELPSDLTLKKYLLEQNSTYEVDFDPLVTKIIKVETSDFKQQQEIMCSAILDENGNAGEFSNLLDEQSEQFLESVDLKVEIKEEIYL